MVYRVVHNMRLYRRFKTQIYHDNPTVILYKSSCLNLVFNGLSNDLAKKETSLYFLGIEHLRKQTVQIPYNRL